MTIEPPPPSFPAASATPLIGVDFSSAPSRRKPIVLARGLRQGAVVKLEGLLTFESLAAFGAWLAEPGPWLGGFDLPFGLPRELVETLGWPLTWPALMDHYARLSRERIRTQFKAFCDARPVGGKFAHRACDGPASSSPSMKWVNPPVAWMLHAGVPLLRAAGVSLPGLGDRELGQGDASLGNPSPGMPERVALEAYPGLLARELLRSRSYKADDKARQTPERLIARKDLVDGLEQGRTRLGLRLRLSHAQRDALVADASGDRLDAVLCLLQAAWAQTQPRFGWPAEVDPLEGWILTA
jgi:hypothetical protein